MTTTPLPFLATENRLEYPAFSLDETGRLSIVVDSGSEPIKVRPLRLFPQTDSEHWIAILDVDGQEVLCLEDPNTLATASKTALQMALQACEFVPQIQRIIHVSGNSEPCQWEVETDRGATVFVLKDDKDVRSLSGGRILIIDGHGIRYQIPNFATLDNYGRRVIEWYV